MQSLWFDHSSSRGVIACRAMEEEQRNARTKAIKRLRSQRVARFKSDLRRHIDAAGQVFDDSMAEDLEILDRVFAEDSETGDGDTAAVDEAATVAEVQLGPKEEGCDETRQREEGGGEEVETAADSIVQEDASVKGTEGTLRLPTSCVHSCCAPKSL